MAINEGAQPREMTEAEAYAVQLTAREAEMLVAMAKKSGQQLSLMIDKPNTRVVNSLVKKGMATDIMGTFWKITDAGRLRVTTIREMQS